MTKIHRELKESLNKLVGLGNRPFALHLALATSDYLKIDDIDDKDLIELIENYIALQDIDDIENFEDFVLEEGDY